MSYADLPNTLYKPNPAKPKLATCDAVDGVGVYATCVEPNAPALPRRILLRYSSCDLG